MATDTDDARGRLHAKWADAGFLDPQQPGYRGYVSGISWNSKYNKNVEIDGGGSGRAMVEEALHWVRYAPGQKRDLQVIEPQDEGWSDVSYERPSDGELAAIARSEGTRRDRRRITRTGAQRPLR